MNTPDHITQTQVHSMNAKFWLAAAVVFAGVTAFCAPASAQITGTVKLAGKAPDQNQIDMSGKPECANMHTDPVFEETIVAGAGGALKNVVVSIKAGDGEKVGDGRQLKDAAVLSQQGCMYVPHVLAMMTGQPLTIKNDDPCNHNVHSLAQDNPQFNFAQPNKGDTTAVDPPKTAETYQVVCDVHAWMKAWVCVFDHPYFAVTGDDGAYSIDTAGLADGDYTLVVWQEKLGKQEVKVTVKDHKGKADATFKPESADATPAEHDAGKPATMGAAVLAKRI